MYASVGGVPGFDDDVVELVAEELVDYAFSYLPSTSRKSARVPTAAMPLVFCYRCRS